MEERQKERTLSEKTNEVYSIIFGFKGKKTILVQTSAQLRQDFEKYNKFKLYVLGQNTNAHCQTWRETIVVTL